MAILIMDNSGSMDSSDPSGLRFSAARLFISLLDEIDSVGVVVFSTNSRALSEFPVQVSDRESREDLIVALENLSPDGYTDVKAALSDARKLATRSTGRVVIVLLTDGKPEIPVPYAGYEVETLDLARSLNIPIHSIALTGVAQSGFLTRLAAATGGSVTPAEDATQLVDAYLGILGSLKDRTVLSSESALSLDEGLSPYVRSATFVFSKSGNGNVQLIRPNGEPVETGDTDVAYSDFDDPRFVSVTITEPAGGDWQFGLEGEDGQVWAILYSSLRAGVGSNHPVHPLNEPLPIVVNITEEQADGSTVKVIGEAAFTATITRPDGSQDSLDRFYDDGTHGDLVAGDGDFTRLYTATGLPGRYAVELQGWKSNVPVGASFVVEILPFPVLVPRLPPGRQDFQSEPLDLSVTFSGGLAKRLDAGTLIARVIMPSGKEKEIEMAFDGESYRTGFIPEESGWHTIRFETRAATYLGMPFNSRAQAGLEVVIVHRVEAQKPVVTVSESCAGGFQAMEVALPLASLRPETIRFELSGSDRIRLEQYAFELKPGEQIVTLRLFPSEGGLSPGEYRPLLRINGSPDLAVTPDANISLYFRVSNPWQRCRAEFTWGGGILVALGLVGLVSLRWWKSTHRPPLVSGTLRVWPEAADPFKAQEYDLTKLSKASLMIGGSEQCEVAIPNAGLTEQHARLHAEWVDGISHPYLTPLGAVYRSYSSVQGLTPLSHGDRFKMGELEFQYLNDEGE